MSKRKGLSFEEKRTRLLELLNEKNEPFLLKDLEKIAPKAKSIPMPTVKEVLTSLVDDSMVDSDKIGTSMYFWAFPSKAFTVKENKVKQLEETVKELEEKERELDEALEENLKNSNESEKDAKRRIEIQEELTEMENERDKLQKEVDRFKDCDPEALEKMEAEVEMAREAVERWTDNVFAIKSWVKKTYHMEDSEICRSLNIPPNFDYFECE